MDTIAPITIHGEIERLFQQESRRVFATLIRLVGDFDLAEEVLQEAFASALEKWEVEGIPQNPNAWLVSTGRNKAIDAIRRQQKFQHLQTGLTERFNEVQSVNETRSDRAIEDDRLRLIFTCCHPAIDPNVQIVLTLREVCGLTTEAIACAFLTSATTMAQRIVRGKAKIRDAKIPYVIPSHEDLPERLDAVLTVIYLVFNEGYSASAGQMLARTDLSEEAIRLARLLLELLPDPEVMGLLALMLLHDSRRQARVDENGEIILLEDQNRTLWNRKMIFEGQELVGRAIASRNFGAYTIQAAISSVHAVAASAAQTDWAQIVTLYDLLLRADPSPVVELNRAVAVAMRDGADAGLAIIDSLIQSGTLEEYHLAHAARGDMLRRLGRNGDARDAFGQALKYAKQDTERRFLERRISELSTENT